MKDQTMRFPKSIQELAKYLKTMSPQGKIICGGTDLIIAMNRGDLKPDCLIDVSQIAAMQQIETKNQSILVGGSCTFNMIACAPELQCLNSLVDAAKAIGSKQIRNKASIAGNIAHALPAGDMLPVLLSLGAYIHKINGDEEIRRISIDEILADKSAGRLGKNEAIIGIEIPLPAVPYRTAFVKLGDRPTVTISKISIAAKIELATTGRLQAVRIAMGAVGETAFRATTAEAFLQGQQAGKDLSQPLGQCLSQEIQQSIPNRQSLAYKKEAVKGLAEDLWSALNISQSLFQLA